MTTTRWILEKIEAPVYGNDGTVMAVGVGISSGSCHVGTIYGRHAQSHAEQIVREHNAHVRMIQSLETAAIALQTPHSEANQSNALESIKAALRLAKGE